MELLLPREADKEEVLDLVGTYIGKLSLEVADQDRQRPWGGFFVIDPTSTDAFIDTFFPTLDKADLYRYGNELGPKILVVQPHELLSWQYHNRRAEIWKDIAGPVGVKTSENDTIPADHELLQPGEIVSHGNQVRHRLIGLDNWGVLAEIWQHTDPNQPSNEEDIVRLEDRYNRN